MKKKAIRCPDVLEHICEELDSKITTAQCRELRRHLANCPNCTAYLDGLKKTIKLYRTYPDEKISQKARKELFAVLKLRG